ncbi:Hypothetical protein KNT65_gp223 [Escherichia phage EcS1]|uniref:DUF7428 domain-containing protein n=1 Tax=Escherichia phage EcS1 TaxID=2083276 RepID=A0A2Z5ZC86_9CAUD|nr:Hypothetical protein KNT65_gp223 [Escherichia phage EcS1]BBC78270.1 Hypothetical protein [Escherichia phage EcS1]
MILFVQVSDAKRLSQSLQSNPMIEVGNITVNAGMMICEIDAPDFIEFPEWVKVIK